MRNIESLLNCCPIVDSNDYGRFPLASQDDFSLMEQYSLEYPDWICMFLFVRKDDGYKRFVEIYIYDVMLFPYSFERFIICDGERLSDDSERMLFEYAKSRSLRIDSDIMNNFNKSIEAVFPEWHYHSYLYDISSVGKAIEHIYYASHQSGPREILFKADLHNIAFNLDKLPSFNLIGTTPTAIVGHNAPLRFLRIMNNPRFINHLFDEKELEHSLKIYRKFSGYIGESISTAQWLYLDSLFSNDGKFLGHPFSRSLYEHLATAEGSYILDEYKAFYLLREKLGLCNRLKVPSPNNVFEVVEKLDSMMYYQQDNTLLTHSFQERKQTEQITYEYSEKTFSVLLPSSPFEICLEAIFQGNCVMEYIERHATNKTTILFVRRNDNPEASFVTLEVNNWQIKQVYGAFNSIPQKEVYIFLMNYAKSKSLYMDTYSLIMNSIDDDMDFELYMDIRRFAESFRYQRIMPSRFSNDSTCVQIELEDLYPWLFE